MILYVSLIMPGFVTVPLIKLLLNTLMSDPSMEAAKIWARDQFLPAMVDATVEFRLSNRQKYLLICRFAGVVTKIGWAFLWQEQFSPLPTWIFTNMVMRVAVFLTPSVNAFATFIGGMPETDLGIVQGINVYPGAKYCNVHSPHALWHQTGNGFLDFVMMGDFVYGLISASE